ncbi:SPW repeat domain-containing protein [Natrinema halophilum]|uniref:SPW repeat-containing integral membrane domain-containing protein n=1 Tax=Natrinema halophilum TaxID=1699371 RepID=A0A7D5L367_9EURY|nr:hypothetical protein [Natrinema halophilum]QLG47785.1 hypothetical protein HYG82_02455 [Natrinema halophilum]
MSQPRTADDASVLAERTAGLTAVLGAFIMISTPVFTITGDMGIHNVVIGAVVAFIAAFQAYRTGEMRSPSVVVAGILALLGIWIAASPFVFGIERELVIGINALGGAIIAILSLVGAYGSVRTSNTTASSA